MPWGEPGVCFYRAESVIYSLLFGVKRQGMLETCEGNATKSAEQLIRKVGQFCSCKEFDKGPKSASHDLND
jgi:hypothetical protein